MRKLELINQNFISKFKDKTCLADLSLNALLGDEGLQSTGLRVLGVAKVQNLCMNKHRQIRVSKR